MYTIHRISRVFPIILVSLAAGISIFFALYRLTEAPAIWYDEGFYTQVAMNLAEQGTEAIQVAPEQFISAQDVTVGYPLIAPVAASYKLFGVGVLQGRAVMVFFIFAFLLAAYAFVYLLYGPWYAAWSVLLLATFPELYGNGKSVLGEVPGMFYLLCALCSAVWLERTAYTKMLPYITLGLMTGLAVATKPIFILLPVAFVLALLIRWRSISLRISGVVAGALVFLVMIGIWMHLQFGAGDSLVSVLNYYINPYDVNAGTTLVQNIKMFATQAVPLYVAGMLVFWGVSMRIRRQKESISTSEVVAFVFCLLIVAAFLRLPGWYRYLFPATLAAMLFLPRAVTDIYSAISARRAVLARVAWLPYLGLALLGLAQVYMLASHSYVAQYYNGTRTQALSAYIATLPQGASYFIYNAPEVVVLLPTRKYYQFISPHPNQLIGASELPILARGGADFVIIGTEVYHKNTELFKAYSERKAVNRFTFLQKL